MAGVLTEAELLHEQWRPCHSCARSAARQYTSGCVVVPRNFEAGRQVQRYNRRTLLRCLSKPGARMAHTVVLRDSAGKRREVASTIDRRFASDAGPSSTKWHRRSSVGQTPQCERARTLRRARPPMRSFHQPSASLRSALSVAQTSLKAKVAIRLTQASCSACYCSDTGRHLCWRQAGRLAPAAGLALGHNRFIPCQPCKVPARADWMGVRV